MPAAELNQMKMALLKYLSKKESILLPDKELCRSLSHEDLKLAGEKIKECLEAGKLTQSESKRGKYNHYDAEKRAQIQVIRNWIDFFLL